MSDDIRTLRRILRECRTVAIVGLSADWHRPSHFVGKYLQQHGWRIVPVNPRYDSILGARSYDIHVGGGLLERLVRRIRAERDPGRRAQHARGIRQTGVQLFPRAAGHTNDHSCVVKNMRQQNGRQRIEQVHRGRC